MSFKPTREERQNGQVLLGAVIIVAVMAVLLPLMVQWSRQESISSTKDQMSMTAFNGVDGAVDRAVWKLKSSTSTWAQAIVGTVITGYNYDATYTDIPGIRYRVRFSSGPNDQQVTVNTEALETVTGQVRAIRAVFENRSLPGPLMSGGLIDYAGAFEAHWGPVMAHGNIAISGNAATEYFPRKFSKQVVTGTVGQPRDVNGLNSPNTDNVEWWSDYPVPDLPLLDFTLMRASAAANGTLNFRTNNNFDGAGQCTGWAGHNRCETGGVAPGSHNPGGTTHHFHDSFHHALGQSNRIWYWDPNINLIMSGSLSGGGCHRLGLWGVVIVRGNLTINSGDCYAYVGPVPAQAWKDYARLGPATFDTAALNQYPADNGLQTNRLTFNHGGETWTGGPPSGNTDVGLRGFIYSGGTLTINSVADIAGTIWSVGNTVNNVVGERVLVFYEGNNPIVPVLNVVLERQSWDEVRPSTITWL